VLTIRPKPDFLLSELTDVFTYQINKITARVFNEA
jgi:hypothetical protein